MKTGRPKVARVEIECANCGSIFEKRVTSTKRFCSIKCGASGIHNSNYNNRWTDEQKANQSIIIRSKIDDVYREACASANSGVKFDQDRINRMHANRSSESYSHKHTAESKRLISIKSSAKYTDEYLDRFRSTMYDLGHWIDPKDKSDYEIYFSEADWVKPMWDLFENVNGNIFNSFSNPNGLVRDHILSRKDGFELGIWPEILRHPCNCQLLTNSQNSSKRRNSWLTFNELSDKILSYSKEWFEQELCLKKIDEFKNGKLWNRKEASGNE